MFLVVNFHLFESFQGLNYKVYVSFSLRLVFRWLHKVVTYFMWWSNNHYLWISSPDSTPLLRLSFFFPVWRLCLQVVLTVRLVVSVLTSYAIPFDWVQTLCSKPNPLVDFVDTWSRSIQNLWGKKVKRRGLGCGLSCAVFIDSKNEELYSLGQTIVCILSMF